MTKQELLEKPVQELGLSLRANDHLKDLGIKKLTDIIEDSNISYGIMIQKLVYEPLLEYTTYIRECYSGEELMQKQKEQEQLHKEYHRSYKEIVEYLRGMGIKFQEEQKEELKPKDIKKQIVSNIIKKLSFLNAKEEPQKYEIIEEIAIEIVEEAPTVATLIEIETIIIREVFYATCGVKKVFTEEQVFPMISKRLGIEEIKIGAIYYQAFEKLRKYIKEEILRRSKENIKIKKINKTI